MEIGKVHHLGYLVKDISKSAVAFQLLGYEVEKAVYFDNERLVNFCFLKKHETRIELVEPNRESDIYPLLKNYNNAVYHVCYEVQNIDKAVTELEKNGFLLFRDKQKALAISENAVVVFMMHIRMGMIELVQER